MPIVLAIEPDRRQAAHLAAIVRQQVGAELILADTTEGALDAIGNRVPDLVLVPALLSPQDDAALAAALRVIAAAAHVRTLTIPVLASGTTRATPGGMLAKWRRIRAASPEPDGCDPAVFGEQISAYLQEAAAERAEIEEGPIEVALQAAIEPPALPAVEQLLTGSIEPPAAELVEPSAADRAEQPLIDLPEEAAGLPDWAGDERFDREPFGIYAISAEAEEQLLAAFDLLQASLAQQATARHAATPIADAEPEDLIVEPPEPSRTNVEPWVPTYLTPGHIWPALDGMPVETPAPRTDQPDWIELVASLRQDLERRRTDSRFATAVPMAARPPDGREAGTPRRVKTQKSRARQSKPVQDEWGFFDPEQCGFSTLLAKLEEITEDGAVV
jgi:hypothetical protein